MDIHEQIRRETANESICPECGIEMEVVSNKKKKNQYSKSNKIYKCWLCGFTHRERTFNELLRDLNERE